MDSDILYLRIGTSVYKNLRQPCADGGTIKRLAPWTYSALCQDMGKDYAATIPKFDGFCSVPDHIAYRREIGGFYNLYNPIPHIAKEGSYEHVISLVKHIFEEQTELGLDYLSLLYLKPVQKLPVLLLVSEERNTGKTTFLNFLKAIFQDNTTFNTNENFRSPFNADWAGKLIIAVDEVLLDRKEDAERIKNLSTARTYKMEAKGKDRQEVEFFGKFVLCSNNETHPIIIDPEETRYWVRKVHHLESDDTHFLEKIQKEIPAFLYYLRHRPLSTQESSRMWFRPEDIHTDALDKIIASSRDRTEVDMVEVLMDIMEVRNLDEVSFCVNDLAGLMNSYNDKSEIRKIRRILKDSWKLQPASNAYCYRTFAINFNAENHYEEVSRVGKYYTVSKYFLKTRR